MNPRFLILFLVLASTPQLRATGEAYIDLRNDVSARIVHGDCTRVHIQTPAVLRELFSEGEEHSAMIEVPGWTADELDPKVNIRQHIAVFKRRGNDLQYLMFMAVDVVVNDENPMPGALVRATLEQVVYLQDVHAPPRDGEEVTVALL